MEMVEIYSVTRSFDGDGDEAFRSDHPTGASGMLAAFPICFLRFEVVNMVGSNLEHGTSFWSRMSYL